MLDYGCGKGRVLMYASKFNFKQIIGIEFSKELCDICIENLNTLDSKACVKVLNQDAATFNVPSDINVFYFYNPFNGEIMNIVVDNIEKSLLEEKRKIFIIYVNPLHKELFENRHYKEVFKFKEEAVIYAK